MAQSTNSNANTQNSNSSQQPSNSGTGSGNKTLLYAGIAAVVIIVAAILLFLPSGSGSTPVVTQSSSANSTPIYMNPYQAQALLGSPLSFYNASDLYSPYAPINISFMLLLVPQLYGNVSSGWATVAYGTNTTSNSSIVFIEMTTQNASSISNLVGSSIIYIANMTTPTVISPGTLDGMSYTYGEYVNSTTTFQTIYGYRNNHVVLAVAEENPGYLVNESLFVQTVVNDTQ